MSIVSAVSFIEPHGSITLHEFCRDGIIGSKSSLLLPDPSSFSSAFSDLHAQWAVAR